MLKMSKFCILFSKLLFNTIFLALVIISSFSSKVNLPCAAFSIGIFFSFNTSIIAPLVSIDKSNFYCNNYDINNIPKTDMSYALFK